MRSVGWILLGVAVLCLLFGLGMDTTVAVDGGSRRVHNIGLLGQQQNSLLLGGVLFLGALGILVGTRKGNAPPPADRTRACPHCAEQIQLAAKICRFCGRDAEPPVEVSGAKAGRPTEEESAAMMTEYGIHHGGAGIYLVNGYRYTKFADALAEAKRARAKSGDGAR